MAAVVSIILMFLILYYSIIGITKLVEWLKNRKDKK